MSELLTTGSMGEVDAATMARLHARLEDSPDLDVTYRTVDSPVGTLLLAATREGVVKIGFTENLDELAAKVSPRILRSPARTDPVARQLDEYFAGHRRHFDVPLDLRLVTGFRAEVVRHLPDIAYGETASYADLARAAGSPKAVRAVGTACALNPLPLVLPCHRVVRSDGATGQYAGGVAAKTYLLALEQR